MRWIDSNILYRGTNGQNGTKFPYARICVYTHPSYLYIQAISSYKRILSNCPDLLVNCYRIMIWFLDQSLDQLRHGLSIMNFCPEGDRNTVPKWEDRPCEVQHWSILHHPGVIKSKMIFLRLIKYYRICQDGRYWNIYAKPFFEKFSPIIFLRTRSLFIAVPSFLIK